MTNQSMSITCIHQIELEILSEFQRICKAHNLRYFAIGGTCIGAIRHKGFIPWDDDIDIAMPEEDYFSFIEIAIKDLHAPYRLITPSDSKHNHLQYIRMENEETTFIQEYTKAWPDRWGGIFMDVMPITGLPKEEKNRNRYIKRLEHYKRYNRLRRMPFSFSESKKWKVFWPVFSIIKWIYPFDFFSKKIDKLRKKYPFSTSDFVYFSWDRHRTVDMMEKKDIFPLNIFSEYIEVPFEKASIRVPIGYDEYLKMDYGDYMKLPEKSKQVSIHPTAIIDTNRSYHYYQRNGIKDVP